MEPNIYQILQFGKSIKVKSEIGEKEPSHIDMLRYDLAFMNPRDPSFVVFPIFKFPCGRTSRSITWDRWRSFSCTVNEVPDGALEFGSYGDWVTYRYPQGNDMAPLIPLTLNAYLAENKSAKIVGWR